LIHKILETYQIKLVFEQIYQSVDNSYHHVKLHTPL